MFEQLLAYGFSGLIILGAFGTILFSKPVHNVLSLIFCFLNAAGLYIILYAEFVALSTLIVYVGAVAVLLLFVVMTLTDVNPTFKKLQLTSYKYGLISIGVILAVEVFLLFQLPSQKTGNMTSVTNIKSIGRLLYIQYSFVFQGCGILLLVAMVSAVIITFQSRGNKQVKRQVPSDQIYRDPNDVIKLVKVQGRKGI